METMRRLYTSLLALSILGAFVGCNHTAGKCDCDKGDDPCSYYGHFAPISGVEPIKALPMPKDAKPAAEAEK
jgi:hypothetical protein